MGHCVDIAQIDELDQLIVAVGLVRPNPDVFNERVKVGWSASLSLSLYLC